MILSQVEPVSGRTPIPRKKRVSAAIVALAAGAVLLVPAGVSAAQRQCGGVIKGNAQSSEASCTFEYRGGPIRLVLTVHGASIETRFPPSVRYPFAIIELRDAGQVIDGCNTSPFVSFFTGTCVKTITFLGAPPPIGTLFTCAARIFNSVFTPRYVLATYRCASA